MAKRPTLPAGCDTHSLKTAIATVAANRQFTAGELREYTHPFYSGRAPVRCDVGKALRVLIKRGFVMRTSKRNLFPTRKGWRWIEGRR